MIILSAPVAGGVTVPSQPLPSVKLVSAYIYGEFTGLVGFGVESTAVEPVAVSLVNAAPKRVPEYLYGVVPPLNVIITLAMLAASSSQYVLPPLTWAVGIGLTVILPVIGEGEQPPMPVTEIE